METYIKRVNNSGISGQLYETRLVSLILFRLLHDDTVQEFFLASNMDEIGAFDDISFRANITGLKKPILVFIQAKHKEDNDKFLFYDLIKNFHDSYVKVKDHFYANKPTSQDVFFTGNFEETDCIFVLYTNGKFYEDSNATNTDLPSISTVTQIRQVRKEYESEFAAKLSSLIGTGDKNFQGSQADYTQDDLEAANMKIVEEEITTLAEHFTKFLNDQSFNMMLDKYIVLYHVLLAQSVVHISEVKSETIIKKEKQTKTAQNSKSNSNIACNKNKTEQVNLSVKSQEKKNDARTEYLSAEKDSKVNTTTQNVKQVSDPNQKVKCLKISNMKHDQGKQASLNSEKNKLALDKHISRNKCSKKNKFESDIQPISDINQIQNVKAIVFNDKIDLHTSQDTQHIDSQQNEHNRTALNITDENNFATYEPINNDQNNINCPYAIPKQIHKTDLKNNKQEHIIETAPVENKPLIRNKQTSMKKSADVNNEKAKIKSEETKSDQKEKKSEPKPEIRKYRELTFRSSFFHTIDKHVTILRDKIYEIVINTQVKNKKKQKAASKDKASTSTASLSSDAEIEQQISDFLTKPSATTLSPLIGSCITYKDNQLNFIVKRSNADVQTLEQINTLTYDLPFIIKEAEIIAARNILLSLNLKVPATFGNIDLTIAGDSDKIEKRLSILTEFIVKLCQASKSNIIIIDKSVGSGFLSLTGGIGSAVGNLFVYDKDTKLLQFQNNCQLLKENARALYDKLKNNNEISIYFNSYRFDTNALIDFPKLEFDYTDEAKRILSKVVVYEKQSNHQGVEKILKQEIEQLQTPKETHNFTVQIDKLVTYYHYKIQTWWMNKSGIFLTKSKNEYQLAVTNILMEPQICALQIAFHMNHVYNNRYDFNETAVNSLAPIEGHDRTIIMTDISILSTLKVLQYLRNKENNKYAVLNLEYVLDLPSKDLIKLDLELTQTEKMIILVCDNPKNLRLVHRTLNMLATATASKQMIVITNVDFVEMARQEYFKPINKLINDEKKGLEVLTPKSMRDVIDNTSIKFQGNETKLNLLVNDKSAGLIKGTVLNKIVRKETVELGTSLSNSNYEKIEHLYIERKVHITPRDEKHLYDYIADYSVQRENKPKARIIRRFEDINEDAVLITGAPGMGKSTLLTRLSLKAKKFNKRLWIVRMNLLDYSKVFFNWQTHNTVIDTLETLKIMCHVINKNIDLDKIILKASNGTVYLEKSIEDEWADFELNMFLHFYNEKKLLFLIDGFDEICPHYKEDVLTFLNIVMNYPKTHKMWVTSRPYSEILPDLQNVLGKSYELEYVSDVDQEEYLDAYWEENLIIEKLNEIKLNKVVSYLQFLRPKNNPQIARIFHLFYDYLYRYFPHIPKYTNLSTNIPTVLNPNLTDRKAGVVQHRVDLVMGTPLLLYLHANYFINLICDDTDSVDWEMHLGYSMLAIYEMFVQSKLKILFKVKNEMDIYQPRTMRKFEKDYMECLDMHKRLAAYSLFFHRIHLDELNHVHPFKGQNEYEETLNEIRCGSEKIGLVSHVTADNIAVFVYKSLEEYFATEYLCDIFDNDDIDYDTKNMLYSIAHVTFNIFLWMTRKMEVDKKLRRKIDDIAGKRPAIVSTYGLYFATGWSIEHLIRIRSSSANDYESGCFEEYNYDFFKGFRRLEADELDLKTKEFQKNLIAKMKPQLKQYFTCFPDEGKYSWPS